MSTEKALLARSGEQCELCLATENLQAYEVLPCDGSVDQSICVCGVCFEQLNDDSKLDANHFRCLNDAMWSAVPAVQVVSYRLLHKMREEGWPQDLLDMMYLEDDIKAWADEGLVNEEQTVTKDSNGATLNAGDTVTIIKDLEVKGAGFTAKRGTAVRNIALTNNPEQIEGRVNGTRIVLLTKFLKKQ
jgi:protein PhnA